MSSAPVRFLRSWSRTACAMRTERCATSHIDKPTDASVLSISSSRRFFQASKKLPMDQPNNEPISHCLQWWAATDRGKIRSNNEDSFLGLQLDSREGHYVGRAGEASTETTDLAFAVSDGMGGATAGEFASRITVDRVTHLLQRSFKQSAVGIGTYFADVFTTVFDQIHQSLMLVGQSYKKCSSIRSTLTICCFTRRCLNS